MESASDERTNTENKKNRLCVAPEPRPNPPYTYSLLSSSGSTQDTGQPREPGLYPVDDRGLPPIDVAGPEPTGSTLLPSGPLVYCVVTVAAERRDERETKSRRCKKKKKRRGKKSSPYPNQCTQRRLAKAASCLQIALAPQMRFEKVVPAGTLDSQIPSADYR